MNPFRDDDRSPDPYRRSTVGEQRVQGDADVSWWVVVGWAVLIS